MHVRHVPHIVHLARSLPYLSQGQYYEALCKDIDPVRKELVCCFPADAGFPEACFKVSYDSLVIAVSRRTGPRLKCRVN